MMWLVVAVLLLAACRKPAPPAEQARLGTIRRMVEPGMMVTPPADPRLAWGSYETLADVAHPVLSSAQQDAPFTSGAPQIVDRPPAEPVPPLVSRTLETTPFTVPPDALLRLSIGIEEPAWSIDSAPVYFRVIVVEEDGRTQDLFRRVLDPTRRATDRRWFDSDVDLSDIGGQKVRLRFLSEPLDATDKRPSLPLWGDPRVLAPAARGATRPSIVLLSLDGLRAKSMSTYGHALETSPNIGALAARGALFERAYTTSARTLPALTSMLTGLHPATHAVLGSSDVLADAHLPLAEILRRAGYATAAFTEDVRRDSTHRLRRGFSTYFASAPDAAGDVAGIFGRALEWAGRNADESFFVFAQTAALQQPHDPPAAYRALFTEPEGPRLGDQQRAYEQDVRYADDVLQRFLDGLRKVVPERELLLIVTAAHGEEFLEHGMTGHEQLFDEVMHVPLAMAWAGRIPAGLRVAIPVSLVDVVPTILAFAGARAPTDLEGTSLAPLLAGKPAALGRDVVFGELPAIPGVSERRFVAHASDEKCVLTAGGNGDVCYDLAHDPDERQPRGAQDTAAFTRVHGAGDAYRTRALGHAASTPP